MAHRGTTFLHIASFETSQCQRLTNTSFEQVSRCCSFQVMPVARTQGKTEISTLRQHCRTWLQSYQKATMRRCGCPWLSGCSVSGPFGKIGVLTELLVVQSSLVSCKWCDTKRRKTSGNLSVCIKKSALKNLKLSSKTAAVAKTIGINRFNVIYNQSMIHHTNANLATPHIWMEQFRV